MTTGPCGYGRYNDDPNHVGCPRAASDMTPCIARDGRLALADDDTCVGCGSEPWPLLVAVKRAVKLTPPSKSQAPDHFADQLAKVVRRVTEPATNEIDRPKEDA